MLVREGIPLDIPADIAISVMRSMEVDPPTRYRVEYWLRMIATILFKAYGGRGDIPLPPWATNRSSRNQEPDVNAFKDYISRIG